MPSTLYSTLSETISNGLKRKSIVNCSTWAEKCRVMGKPFPGPFSFKHFPWSRAMHDCNAEKWVCQKSAQAGVTEAALNRVLYTIDMKRIDCLYILPSERPDAVQFSAARFNPALELSPYLKALFSDVNNTGHKRAGTTNLYIRGSKSRSQLKSIPAGLLVLDELDEMTQKNLSLATERQAGQIERQEINISTPTIAGRGINLVYEESTQNHFYFRCPSCSRFTELTYPDCLVVTGESLHDPRINESYIRCKECKNKLIQELKSEWLAQAEWVPQYSNRPVVGWHINQLYSATQTPAILATKVRKAELDPSEEQELHNSMLGEVHEVKGARVTEEDIVRCIHNYPMNPNITAGNLITMGVDQGASIDYEINSWHPLPNSNNSSTDINLRFQPKVLSVGSVREFEELDNLMRKWRIGSCVIDAHPEKRAALSFASRFTGFVHLCFYGEGATGKNVVLWANEPSITVDRTSWMDLSLTRFRKGLIILPKNLPENYKNHIKAPVRVTTKDKHGNPVSRYMAGDRIADHFAHARTYSEIALQFALDKVNNQSVQSPI